VSFRDIHSSVGAAASYTNSGSHKLLEGQARRGIAGDEAKGGGVGEDGGLELVMPDHEGLDACGDVVLFCNKLVGRKTEQEGTEIFLSLFSLRAPVEPGRPALMAGVLCRVAGMSTGFGDCFPLLGDVGGNEWSAVHC
jgi:hypothetical protein